MIPLLSLLLLLLLPDLVAAAAPEVPELTGPLRLHRSLGRGRDSSCTEPPPPLRDAAATSSSPRRAGGGTALPPAPKHLQYLALDGYEGGPDTDGWTSLGFMPLSPTNTDLNTTRKCAPGLDQACLSLTSTSEFMLCPFVLLGAHSARRASIQGVRHAARRRWHHRHAVLVEYKQRYRVRRVLRPGCASAPVKGEDPDLRPGLSRQVAQGVAGYVLKTTRLCFQFETREFPQKARGQHRVVDRIYGSGYLASLDLPSGVGTRSGDTGNGTVGGVWNNSIAKLAAEKKLIGVRAPTESALGLVNRSSGATTEFLRICGAGVCRRRAAERHHDKQPDCDLRHDQSSLAHWDHVL